jgi:hypothetical protein
LKVGLKEASLFGWNDGNSDYFPNQADISGSIWVFDSVSLNFLRTRCVVIQSRRHFPSSRIQILPIDSLDMSAGLPDDRFPRGQLPFESTPIESLIGEFDD